MPQGTVTPVVAEFPRGDKTSGVTTAGEGKPMEDRQGWGGEPPPPTVRSTRSQGDCGSKDEWMGGQRTGKPLHPQRGTAADNGSIGTPTRRTAGTDGAKPKHSALARREVRLTGAERDGGQSK